MPTASAQVAAAAQPVRRRPLHPTSPSPARFDNSIDFISPTVFRRPDPVYVAAGEVPHRPLILLRGTIMNKLGCYGRKFGEIPDRGCARGRRGSSPIGSLYGRATAARRNARSPNRGHFSPTIAARFRQLSPVDTARGFGVCTRISRPGY